MAEQNLHEIIMRQYEFIGIQETDGKDDFKVYNCKHCHSTIAEQNLYEHIKQNHKFENLDFYVRIIDIGR